MSAQSPKALVGYVAGDMRKHRLHPRWSRITLCDQVIEQRGWSYREQLVTCTTCRKKAGLPALAPPPPPSGTRLREPTPPETLEIWLRCECGQHQLRDLPADEPLRAVLRTLQCLFCLDYGRCHLAPRKDSLTPHAQ